MVDSKLKRSFPSMLKKQHHSNIAVLLKNGVFFSTIYFSHFSITYSVEHAETTQNTKWGTVNFPKQE